MRIFCDYCGLDYEDDEVLPYNGKRACRTCQIIEEGRKGNVMKGGGLEDDRDKLREQSNDKYREL